MKKEHEMISAITLRDFFASHAMQGMFASGNISKSVTNEEIAGVVYAMADAMIKARDEEA